MSRLAKATSAKPLWMPGKSPVGSRSHKPILPTAGTDIVGLPGNVTTSAMATGESGLQEQESVTASTEMMLKVCFSPKNRPFIFWKFLCQAVSDRECQTDTYPFNSNNTLINEVIIAFNYKNTLFHRILASAGALCGHRKGPELDCMQSAINLAFLASEHRADFLLFTQVPSLVKFW